MGCDVVWAAIGRGDGGVVWTGGLSELLFACEPSKGFWGRDLGDFGGWAVISLRRCWARGEGVLSGLGGCRDCCSPVAKCPKDEVGNGRIMGFGM